MALEKVIGVDLGGTNIRVAVLDNNGTISHTTRKKTRSELGYEAVIARIGDLINDVATEAGLGPDVPVGVASPGPLNPRKGIVHYTPNLPGWREVPLVEKLEKIVDRRVTLANDGNCATLGEMRFGVAQGKQNLIYLALGTGIGGGVVTEGVLIDGKNGLGSEIGHTLVAIDGPRCTCGSIGCLEAFTSGWAIQAEAIKVATTADGDRLKQLAGEEKIHAGIVAKAAAEGHPASIAILERAGRALGAAIGSFITMFDPEMIVIGGGVAVLGEQLLGPARKMIPQYSFVDMRENVPVVYSELGGDTGIYGAGALAFMMFAEQA